MDLTKRNHPSESFQAESYSLIRVVYLAADAKPNEPWFIGNALELQDELFLSHYTELDFELGDEIKFRKSIMKVGAIEAAPLSSSPSLPATKKVITYYVASSTFPLMQGGVIPPVSVMLILLRDLSPPYGGWEKDRRRTLCGVLSHSMSRRNH